MPPQEIHSLKLTASLPLKMGGLTQKGMSSSNHSFWARPSYGKGLLPIIVPQLGLMRALFQGERGIGGLGPLDSSHKMHLFAK